VSKFLQVGEMREWIWRRGVVRLKGGGAKDGERWADFRCPGKIWRPKNKDLNHDIGIY
jgi:hypothetical protein